MVIRWHFGWTPNPARVALEKAAPAIEVRLTRHRVDCIWPGLDFIVRANLTRLKTGSALNSYPFRMYPLPRGIDVGIPSARLMTQVQELWTRLGSRRSGGSITLDSIDVRIAILSARLSLKLARSGAPDWADRAPKLQISEKALHKIKQHTRRIVRSLERMMKCADRRFISLRSREGFKVLTREWKAHLRWMKFHLIYFKQISADHPKRGRLIIIDGLEEIAKEGIQHFGYELPDLRELRRVMRLYAVHCRRGREPLFNFSKLAARPHERLAQAHLVDFVLARLDLKEVEN